MATTASKPRSAQAAAGEAASVSRATAARKRSTRNASAERVAKQAQLARAGDASESEVPDSRSTSSNGRSTSGNSNGRSRSANGKSSSKGTSSRSSSSRGSTTKAASGQAGSAKTSSGKSGSGPTKGKATGSSKRGTAASSKNGSSSSRGKTQAKASQTKRSSSQAKRSKSNAPSGGSNARSSAGKSRASSSAGRARSGGGKSRASGREGRSGGSGSGSDHSPVEATKHAASALFKPTGRRKHPIARTVAKKALKKVGERSLGAGGDAIRSLAQNAGSASRQALRAGVSRIVEDRPPIQASVDVAAPISVVWSEWMSFEWFTEGVHNIEDVERSGDQLNGQISAPHERDWSAEVVDERDEQAFAWRSVEGTDCAGLITFHKLSDRLTRVEADLDVLPTNPAEAFLLTLPIPTRRAERQLQLFKAHVEFINPDVYETEDSEAEDADSGDENAEAGDEQADSEDQQGDSEDNGGAADGDNDD